MTRLPLADFPAAVKAQATLPLADGRPIDYAVQPPSGCRGDLVVERPCTRTECRFHAWRQTEIPGRPHNTPPGELPNGRPDGGARPPVRLRVIDQSCMWDVVRANPEGMTADQVGEILGSGVDSGGGHSVTGGVPVRNGDVPPKTAVGERVLQLENRALLKMKAIDHVVALLEDGRAGMPNGTELELVMPHNDHLLPHQCFVTVAIRVREQTAKGGVTVRRKGAK